jgi:hypothetical protein
MRGISKGAGAPASPDLLRTEAAVAIEEFNRKLEITDLTLAQFAFIFGGNGIPYSALDYE